MSCLAGTSWDVIYDLSGQHPRHVRDVAGMVNDDAHYVFISTGNVYSDMSVEGPLTEDSPVFDVSEGDVHPNSMDAYGQFKALAESEVRRRFARHHIVRPGLIVGPGDPSDRLTYWVTRFADSGRHIVPEAIDASLQFIDVRDLAEWLAHLDRADGARLRDHPRYGLSTAKEVDLVGVLGAP